MTTERDAAVEEAREALRRFAFGRLRTTWNAHEYEQAVDVFQRAIERAKAAADRAEEPRSRGAEVTDG